MEVFWFIITNLMCTSVEIINGASNEHRLIDNLLMDYQKYERPVANESLPVDLKFTLSLQQIIDLDERNQLLVTNLWLDYTWEDMNLVWNKVSTCNLPCLKYDYENFYYLEFIVTSTI